MWDEGKNWGVGCGMIEILWYDVGCGIKMFWGDEVENDGLLMVCICY